MKPVSKALLISFAVVVAFLLLYNSYDKKTGSLSAELLIKIVSVKDLQFTLRELNKIAALAGITLLSLAFLPGPLTKLFPKNRMFGGMLLLRKPLGIAGVVLILLHSIYSGIAFYELSWEKVAERGREIAIGSGVLSLLIFVVIALFSTKKAVKKLGYEKWKALQRIGYVALLLGLIHFIVIETKAAGFEVRPFGYFALAAATIVLLLKAIAMLYRTAERKRYEEHFQPSK